MLYITVSGCWCLNFCFEIWLIVVWDSDLQYTWMVLKNYFDRLSFLMFLKINVSYNLYYLPKWAIVIKNFRLKLSIQTWTLNITKDMYHNFRQRHKFGSLLFIALYILYNIYSTRLSEQHHHNKFCIFVLFKNHFLDECFKSRYLQLS